ncbi:hypothetical protein Vretimale_12732 [Volvox reticuliferus]|uniref:Uncharacterized protein n=1 Tax=Volvox reticuliferus TaxID=1737510 RepID=A0A8J4LTK8_9CHLO|nr:hypothetical protein Vretifemale_10073 [Volvox reticuliferus]GIM08751.1 hypothetical protein Vretimale_12732 [Volvox reticuliferus]
MPPVTRVAAAAQEQGRHSRGSSTVTDENAKPAVMPSGVATAAPSATEGAAVAEAFPAATVMAVRPDVPPPERWSCGDFGGCCGHAGAYGAQSHCCSGTAAKRTRVARSPSYFPLAPPPPPPPPSAFEFLILTLFPANCMCTIFAACSGSSSAAAIDVQNLCPEAVDELCTSRAAVTGTGGAHQEETTLA